MELRFSASIKVLILIQDSVADANFSQTSVANSSEADDSLSSTIVNQHSNRKANGSGNSVMTQTIKASSAQTRPVAKTSSFLPQNPENSKKLDRSLSERPLEKKLITSSNVWSSWGSWHCMGMRNNACAMIRYRTCSTGNSADCTGLNYHLSQCDKTVCPAFFAPTTESTTTPHVTKPSVDPSSFGAWSRWGHWQCMTVRGACVVIRYRTSSTGNSADCPGKNYNIDPCSEAICPAFFTTTTITTSKPRTSTSPSTLYDQCRDATGLNCSSPFIMKRICSDRTMSVQYCRKTCNKCNEKPIPITRNQCGDPVANDYICPFLDGEICVCKDDDLGPIMCQNYCAGRCGPIAHSNAACTGSLGLLLSLVVAKAHTRNLDIFSSDKSSMENKALKKKFIMPSTAPNATTTTAMSHTTKKSINTLPPTTTRCFKCAGPPETCDLSIYEDDCPAPDNYCINHVVNKASGQRLIQRGCGNVQRCYKDWYLGSSDDDKCRQLTGSMIQTYDFECTFCCTKDGCNHDLHPMQSTLYSP